MNFIKNMTIVEQACTQFLQPHPCYYNLPLEITPILKNYPQLTLEVVDLKLTTGFTQDSYKHSKKLNLIRNKLNPQNCLVYLHGLSSYCLQGKFLIPLLADNLNLCMFDARAHGKNKQKLVTYGLLQSQELYDIVRHLIKIGFKNIILWGRSMGAVTCLKLLQRLKGCQMIDHIKYVVADAPFSSFKTIASEIVSKKAYMPQFISGIFADAFVEKIKQKHGIDLNLLELQQLSTVVPINFLYSSSDELMSQKHIQNIVKNNRSNFEVNDIKVLHNEERPSWVVSKIITKIRQKLNKTKRFIPCFNPIKKRGLSITKFSQQQLSFPSKPIPFSSSQITQDFSGKNNKKNMTKREIVSQTYGGCKQNIQSFRKKGFGKFKFELGGNRVDLLSNRLLPSKKTEKQQQVNFLLNTETNDL